MAHAAAVQRQYRCEDSATSHCGLTHTHSSMQQQRLRENSPVNMPAQKHGAMHAQGSRPTALLRCHSLHTPPNTRVGSSMSTRRLKKRDFAVESLGARWNAARSTVPACLWPATTSNVAGSMKYAEGAREACTVARAAAPSIILLLSFRLYNRHLVTSRDLSSIAKHTGRSPNRPEEPPPSPRHCTRLLMGRRTASRKIRPACGSTTPSTPATHVRLERCHHTQCIHHAPRHKCALKTIKPTLPNNFLGHLFAVQTCG